MRQRLFRPFATSKARGTGLGLAIAQKLTHLHQGRIHYSPRDPGSSFVIEIPIALRKEES